MERDMAWTVLDREYLSKHIYFTARKDRCQRPDGTIVPEYFVVEMPTSVCILPITRENEVIMIRQYRHPIGQTILEIPGGFTDPLEGPADTARRELLEETGYAFDKIEHLATVASNPGVLQNFTALYLATGGRKVQGQSLDANEDIELVLVPLEEVVSMVRENKLVQSLHTCAILYALIRLGRLSFNA